MRVAGGCCEPTQVLNSLRQGCVMARGPFNLYVLETFLKLLSRLHLESSVGMHVNINWNLLPPSTRYSPISNDRISDLEYTGDWHAFVNRRRTCLSLPCLHSMLLPLNLVYQSTLWKPSYWLRTMVLFLLAVIILWSWFGGKARVFHCLHWVCSHTKYSVFC